jgi:hypothetical protein
MICCHNGGILMKLSCRLLILALLSGLMAAAIAQPTNNQVPQKEISAVSKDEAAKQATAAKLERIRIPEFNVEHLGLGEVLHRLNTNMILKKMAL